MKVRTVFDALAKTSRVSHLMILYSLVPPSIYHLLTIIKISFASSCSDYQCLQNVLSPFQ